MGSYPRTTLLKASSRRTWPEDPVRGAPLSVRVRALTSSRLSNLAAASRAAGHAAAAGTVYVPLAPDADVGLVQLQLVTRRGALASGPGRCRPGGR